ncbi:hypothetical protein [Companilactobacillus mishanensis]|uniref:Uncharacterized protein n=1 Tax=Companilactobacillus mishanensis TaxID=2486008 RepID=A0ABW9P459_9LACO|nr:hypothetical protein [Companilactobacillus mishanensis]MQS43892.1 hypothetical protein [Companilactobacillus mishanensis]
MRKKSFAFSLYLFLLLTVGSFSKSPIDVESAQSENNKEEITIAQDSPTELMPTETQKPMDEQNKNEQVFDNEAKTEELKTPKSNDEMLVYPQRFVPTPDPIRALGWWFTSGFTVQPKKDYYIEKGKSVTIKTKSDRNTGISLVFPFTPQVYDWYHIDAKNIKPNVDPRWYSPTSTFGQTRKIKVNGKEVGTVFYQLHSWWTYGVNLHIQPNVFSKVAAVHTLPNPVNASSIKLVAEDDYLYNVKGSDNATTLDIIPDPENSTGETSYRLKNPGNANIATVTTDGDLIANIEGLSGTVTVIGEMKNPDGTILTDTKEIRIGGGLDDQSVYSGEDVEFKLLGKFDQSPTSTKWYRKDGVLDPKEISTENNGKLIIPKAKISDDNSQYYAELTFNYEDPNSNSRKTKIITTNTATLQVTDSEPTILVKNDIFNETYDDNQNDNQAIRSVAKNDIIHRKINIKDESKYFETTEIPGTLRIPYSNNEKLQTILIDGVAIPNSKYSLSQLTDNKEIVFSNFKINRLQTYEIELITKVQNHQNSIFRSSAYFENTTFTGLTYKKHAMDNSIYFIKNCIEISTKPINYGVRQKLKGLLIERKDVMDDFEAIHILDSRRMKNHVQLYLTVKEPFKNIDPNNHEKIPIEFQYYIDEHNINEITDKPCLVEETDEGESLKSLTWSKTEGLKLYIADNQFEDGKFKSSLCWSLLNTPK